MPDNSLIQQILITLLPCARHGCSDIISHTILHLNLDPRLLWIPDPQHSCLRYCSTLSGALRSPVSTDTLWSTPKTCRSSVRIFSSENGSTFHLRGTSQTGSDRRWCRCHLPPPGCAPSPGNLVFWVFLKPIIFPQPPSRSRLLLGSLISRQDSGLKYARPPMLLSTLKPNLTTAFLIRPPPPHKNPCLSIWRTKALRWPAMHSWDAPTCPSTCTSSHRLPHLFALPCWPLSLCMYRAPSGHRTCCPHGIEILPPSLLPLPLLF